MRYCAHCEKERDDSQFNQTHRWCIICRREYNQIHRHHDTKLRVMPKTRDLDLPPITMAYITLGKEVIHGFCKERLYFIGTTEARYGKEIRFFCAKCVESVILPEVIMERLQVWRDDPTWDRLHAGGTPARGDNLVPA